MATIIRLSRVLALVLLCLPMATSVPAFAAKADVELGENEVKIGKDSAAEVIKDYKLSDNAADLKRVREIGAKIVAVANKQEVKAVYGSPKVTPFDYVFNIIEDKDVNAFSLPGGHIYVYRGLLDFVQSDHELAGVIAHEITHASHHHMVYLLKKQASLGRVMEIALLAAMLGGARSDDVGNILYGVQFYQIARLNGYGMQAERDADYCGAVYTREAGYNPVGLLTFLERLAKRPEMVEYGIYRSHPLDADRVRAAMYLIQEMGLPLNRRDTTRAIKAEVKLETVDGVQTPGVVIEGSVIYRPAAQDGKTPDQLAKDTADSINRVLDDGLKIHELRIDRENACVIARNKPLLLVSVADARLMGKTAAAVAMAAEAAIRNIVWKQMVNTIH